MFLEVYMRKLVILSMILVLLQRRVVGPKLHLLKANKEDCCTEVAHRPIIFVLLSVSMIVEIYDVYTSIIILCIHRKCEKCFFTFFLSFFIFVSFFLFLFLFSYFCFFFLIFCFFFLIFLFLFSYFLFLSSYFFFVISCPLLIFSCYKKF